MLLYFGNNFAEAQIEISSKMAQDSSTYLFRWAELTIGFELEKNEQILYTDENVIVVGKNFNLKSVVATYNFLPTVLPPNLQIQFLRTESLNLGAHGFNKSSGNFYKLPEWMGSLTEIKSLALWNTDLSGFAVVRDFPVVYLDLRNVRYSDSESIIDTICSLKKMEIFICDDSFPNEDLSLLKEQLKHVQFIVRKK